MTRLEKNGGVNRMNSNTVTFHGSNNNSVRSNGPLNTAFLANSNSNNNVRSNSPLNNAFLENSNASVRSNGPLNTAFRANSNTNTSRVLRNMNLNEILDEIEQEPVGGAGRGIDVYAKYNRRAQELNASNPAMAQKIRQAGRNVARSANSNFNANLVSRKGRKSSRRATRRQKNQRTQKNQRNQKNQRK